MSTGLEEYWWFEAVFRAGLPPGPASLTTGSTERRFVLPGGRMDAISRVSDGMRMLSEAKTAFEALRISDAAEAYRYMLKMSGASEQAQREASELKLRAERRAGELLRDMPKAEGARGTGSNQYAVVRSEGETAPTYSEQGIDKRVAARAQVIAQISQERFEAFIAEAPELSTAGILKVAAGPHVSHNSGENEWYTPAEYIEAAREVMGEIDLDPASTEKANEVVKAKRFFSIDDDGLSKHWKGRVWMNPPYASNLVGLFVDKLIDQLKNGVGEAIVLVNNATETQWFQAMSCSAICFPAGRVHFWSPEKESSSPLQGQAILYFGTKQKKFGERFSSFGKIFYA